MRNFVHFLYISSLRENYNPKIGGYLQDHLLRKKPQIQSTSDDHLLAGHMASETINLKPENIDNKTMLIKVEEGKGKKDRSTLCHSLATPSPSQR